MRCTIPLVGAVVLLLAPARAALTCELSDVVFGVPSYGCCHFARLAAVYCDPSLSDPRANGAVDAASAQQRCAELVPAAPRSETRAVSGWSDCKALCDADLGCKIWSYEPPERSAITQRWMPAICALVAETLRCSPSICAKAGAYAGQKDCGTNLLVSSQAAATGASQTALDQVYQQQPLCSGRVSRPPTKGVLQAGQAKLDAGCRYAVWDAPATSSCLRGTWVVNVGGSNTILMTIQLANQLAAGTFHPVTTNAATFRTNVLDAVFENGNRIHRHSELLLQSSDTDWTDNLAQFGAALGRAPAHAAGRIRVTQLVGQYWANLGHAIDIVESQASWAAADIILVVQISQWYLVCGVYKLSFCNRRSLMAMDAVQAYFTFRQEMASVLDNKLSRFCAPGGRGGTRGCAVLNNAYDPNQVQAIQGLNQQMEALMATRASPQLRFVDMWALGEGAPQESIKAHSSPVVLHWLWQVVFAGACSAGGHQAAAGAFAAFSGPTCFAADVLSSYSQCPAYAGGCAPSCELWECSHSARCTLGASNSTPATGAAGAGLACRAQPDIVLDWSMATLGGRRSTCDRVLCEEALEFIWPFASAALALATLAVRHRRQLKELAGRLRGQQGAASAEGTGAGPAQQSEGEAPKEGNVEGGEDNRDVEERSAMAPGPPPEDNAAPEGAPNEPSTQEAAKPVAAMPADRFPLGLARFLASLHVVAGHLQGRSAIADAYFFGWGFTWVPWFFMLSGFVLFSAELRKPTKENVLQYVSRRSVTIYPLYAFSLLPSFAILKYLGRAPDWGYLIAQVWLVQAWVPHLTEQVLQTHCWFLSCMVVYWVAFLPLAGLLKRFSLRATVASMAALFLLPWLVIVIPALAGDLDWYQAHQVGDLEEQVDVWVVFLKFHPISYFHVFLLGMLLARLRHQLAPVAGSLRWAVEAMTPAGYLVIVLIMAVEPLRPWAAKLSMRLSIVLPCQAAILFGLAGLPGARPTLAARLASPVEFLADYSYSVYIFQWICYYLWPVDGWVSFAFVVFLVATAVIMQITVQLPAQYAWKRWPYARPAVPLVLCAVLGGFSALDDRSTSAPASAALADVVEPEQGMRDLRLRLSPRSDAGGDLMNTALFVQGDQLTVASRRHKLEYRQYAGQYNGRAVTVVDQVYSSEIALGRGAFDPGWNTAPSITVADWSGLRTSWGTAWTDLCVKERYIAANNTLMRKVVTGPEDPKIFAHGSGLSVTFNSLPPLGTAGCAFPLGANQQMYLANGVDPGQPASPVVGRRIRCGFTRRDEKNWIPLRRDGMLYAIYSPHPHKVALLRDDGKCEIAYLSTYAPFARLVQGRPNLHIRGSGQGYIIDDKSNTPNLARRHGLALFHVFDSKTGLYAHFAYRFSPDPPFEILQVSRQLPLQIRDRLAFVSGLMVHAGKVVISYSAGDLEPRALTMSVQKFDSLFQDCGLPPRYSIHKEQPSMFDAAQAACQREGKNLVAVRNQEDHNELWALVSREKTAAWIGLHRQGRTDWAWTDGRPAQYSNWGSNEQVGQGKNEDCASIGFAYVAPLFGMWLSVTDMWYSLPCNVPLPYVCEA